MSDKCDCIVCRYGRNEVSKDFLKGCLEAEIGILEDILHDMRKIGISETGLSSDENTIGHLMSVIRCNLDDSESIYNDVFGEKN